MARCRVVATRTGTREPPADSAVGISTPCKGRPAQEQDINATAKAPVARRRLDALAALPTMMRALVRTVWKTERSQNNNNPPIQIRLRLLIHLNNPDRFFSSALSRINSINGGRREMLDSVGGDPNKGVCMAAGRNRSSE